jgi:hypothetical protein
MTLQAAEKTLWDLRDLNATTATDQNQAAIRQALQTLAAASDYQMFGVCADSQAAGLQALQTYAHHFGYDLPSELTDNLPQIAGSIYMKYNPRSRLCYVDIYTGTARGVLGSFQSDYADRYSGTHGHYSLDLFA